jgi:hypothetical protein
MNRIRRNLFSLNWIKQGWCYTPLVVQENFNSKEDYGYFRLIQVNIH